MNMVTRIFHLRTGIKISSTLIYRIIDILVILVLLLFISISSLSIIETDKTRSTGETTNTKTSPLAANANRDYGQSGFNKVGENKRFIIYADTTSGEISLEDKTTNEIWYSNPQNRATDKYVSVASRLASQMVLNVIDISTGSISEVDNYAASIKQGCMDWNLIENGIQFTFSFPRQGIVIPVAYTITDSGLQASILADQIQELWTDRYLLKSVDFLPFFGAGGLEDNGYLVIPDGSGAVMNFNNGKERFSVYNQPVYGSDDMVVSDTTTSNIEQIFMPIFGIQKNSNGFLAVIADGASEAYIKASVSKKSSSYNQVYSQMVYRNFSYISVSGSDVLLDSGDPFFSENKYTIDYFMLDEANANYTGMANRYRQYLEDNGEISISNNASNAMVLDVYGAVSLEKYVMGIKSDVITPLTTYDEILSIMNDLIDNGAESIFNYIGALDGGLQNKTNTSFSGEKKLGSDAAFNHLLTFASNNNIKLFFQWDPINLYKSGNGYSVNKNSVKTFFDAYAYQYNYQLNTLTAAGESRSYLFKPTIVLNLIKAYCQTTVSKQETNISIAEIGKNIYSDYDEDAGLLSRNTTMNEWKNVLRYAKDNSDMLLLDGSNSYGYAYANALTDVPFSSSNFDMTDYTVPLLQIALHGAIQMYSNSLNFSSDYETEFLHAVETGCGIKYSVVYGDVNSLMNTKYNNLVACSYENWKDTIIKQDQQLTQLFEEIGNQSITGHEYLASGVTKTVYKDGIQVIVNYNQEEYTDGNITVPAKDYIIIY